MNGTNEEVKIVSTLNEAQVPGGRYCGIHLSFRMEGIRHLSIHSYNQQANIFIHYLKAAHRINSNEAQNFS
ncbi:hypothetical protein QN277_008889 [Acacia crassicarpa]|uniref:Uncharacterized protein n=1 Tax=Acacia crassicarpa TaxID=499986 RepID=A0AAE1IR81_9FABA|nr:hypothetical protein QN277_008889 [Acacia crassicarpa]